MTPVVSQPLPSRRPSRRDVATSIGRICVGTGVLFGVFAVAPFDPPTDRRAALWLLVSILLLVSVFTLQIMAVARSPYPRLKAVEAVAISFPLVIFSFASTYYGMSRADAASFNEAITRADAVYFTITVFTTVGFGDIVATTQSARVTVTVQMVVDLLLIGVIARVLLGTVRHREQALGRGTANPDRGTAEMSASADGRSPHDESAGAL